MVRKEAGKLVHNQTRKRKEKEYYYVKRVIQIIPKSKEFKRNLRNQLLQNWNYASHYVDSAIKTAYSIISSWRRNYLKGRRRRVKPIVRRKFVRVKETLYVYRNDEIRITVNPKVVYLRFDLQKVWFKKRVESCDLGVLVITFRRPLKRGRVAEYIGWDLNKYSLDGFSPRYGWIRVDLGELYHIHRVHEVKKRRAQSKASKKPSLKPVGSKHGRREKNRAKDFVHKLSTQLSRTFPNAVHGFEDPKNQKHVH